MKIRLFLLFLLLCAMAACGGGNGNDETITETDPDTGLPLNPETLPDGPFIVEGSIANLNLTPQDKPEFVIRVASGKTYRIRSQPLSNTTYDDGEAIAPSAFTQGMRVRATVVQIEADGSSGRIRLMVSEDLTIIKEP